MAVDIEFSLRERLYGHLQKLGFSFYDANQTGQLMSRTTNDLSAVRVFLSYGLLFVTQHVLTIVATSIVLLWVQPLLALPVLATMPFLVWIAVRYSHVSHPLLVDAQARLADVTTQAEESVVGVRVVKSFGQEPRQLTRFRDRSEDVFRANIRANRQRAIYLPILELIPSLGLAIVILLGGWLVIHGRMTIGEFVEFNLLLGIVVPPLRMLGMWVGQLQRAVASGARIVAVLDTEPELVSGAQPLPAGRGAVDFRGVSFGYGPDRPTIVDDVSFTLEAGSTVALIGPTGCGKTTLASLVPRFYDVTAGAVLVDGVDVRELRLDELRRQVGVVSEDPFLFSDTVRANIAFGRPDASDEEVRVAARRAQAAEFIESLPLGYETVIGERGLTLSGGQRQRLAIARALLTNPRILILDDATASVDATTEARIKEALTEVMEGRTTLIVAHRMSTIALADRILVLDGGRIVADGDHDTLAHESPLYASIRSHATLAEAFVDLDGDEHIAEVHERALRDREAGLVERA
jgi:ABC-type multidrug transport system fused ATPase/permease subunit